MRERMLFLFTAIGIVGTLWYCSSLPDLTFIDNDRLPPAAERLSGYRAVLGADRGFLSYPVSAAPDFLVRKLGHLGIYGILAVSLDGVLASARGALTLTVLLAGIDEFHQSFVPGRDCQLGDIIVDTTGALIFLWLKNRLAIAYGSRAKARKENSAGVTGHEQPH